MPKIDAITAAAIYPAFMLLVFLTLMSAPEGAVGVVVTVWVTMLPLKVTTCTFVTGVGENVDLGAEALSYGLAVVTACTDDY
jgi:hypothetical protein